MAYIKGGDHTATKADSRAFVRTKPQIGFNLVKIDGCHSVSAYHNLKLHWAGFF